MDSFFLSFFLNFISLKTKTKRFVGDVHEGSYKKGKMDGPGKFTYATGAVYEGNYKDG
jgi:hypothetical protein